MASETNEAAMSPPSLLQGEIPSNSWSLEPQADPGLAEPGSRAGAPGEASPPLPPAPPQPTISRQGGQPGVDIGNSVPGPAVPSDPESEP